MLTNPILTGIEMDQLSGSIL